MVDPEIDHLKWDGLDTVISIGTFLFDFLMSTLAQGDSIIDISDEILDSIDVAPIEIIGVDGNPTDAVEIRLNSEDGTAIRTETTGSTVLTGEALTGTEEFPASISLVSDGSNEVQTVAVNTVAISNTVITTAESVDGSFVAAAQIVISSETVESVSIKTASTDQKSQVRFDQTTESLEGVQIEMVGAGGNLDIQSASVEGLVVNAAGTEFSEITFGTEVETVANANIQVGAAGGSIEVEGGSLSSSTFAIASDRNAVNTVAIGANVEAVADTPFELTQGSTNIGIASAVAQDITFDAGSKEGTTVSVSSESIDSLTFNAQRAASSLTLAPSASASSRSLSRTKRSSATIEDTVLSSTAKKNGALTAVIDGVSADTTLTNERGGLIDVSFSEKAFSPIFSNEGNKKARIEADFAKVAKNAEFMVEKGSVDSTFNAKVNGLDVDASSTKQAISLEFSKSVEDATLSLGKGADTVIFGGAVKGSSSLDLGNDGKADIVTIESPGKINTPFTISNVGGKDIFIYGGEDFFGRDLSADSFENITLEFK